MKIQLVNSQVGFKAIYSTEKANYTESQLKIIDDIKSKTSDKMDFAAEPVDKDKIALYRLYEVNKTEVNGIDRYTPYSSNYIGTYDEKNPFKKEDLIPPKDNIHRIIAMYILAIGAVLISNSIVKSCTKEMSPVVKNTTTLIKDSLQKVAKDTLDLTKQFVK